VKSIGEVIEELISNSIRHGKAKKIDLRVNRSNGKDVEIVAIDNAVIPPPQTQVEFGLGTRIFNLVSDGRWSITRVGFNSAPATPPATLIATDVRIKSLRFISEKYCFTSPRRKLFTELLPS
jgi:hypothetical protein